jgi:hypothetical protein
MARLRARSLVLARWMLSATGALTLLSAVLLALGVATRGLRFLGPVGALGLVLVVAQVATYASRRANAADGAIARLQAELRKSQQARRDLESRILTQVDERFEGARQARSRYDEAVLGRVRSAEGRTTSIGKAVSSQGQALESQKQALESQRRALDRLASSVESFRGDQQRARLEESSIRSLAIACNLPQPKLSRVALLLTIHRSGSTRLFDMLRTHPGVRVAATMEAWHALGLEGRRYPVAFSDTSDGRLAIEVQTGRGALIPPIERAAVAEWDDTQWAVEKAHPQFFDFDTDAFVDHARTLQASGVELLIAYQVRRPLDAMWSMIEFKRRQPGWYSWLEPEKVPAWIRDSLDSIAVAQDRIPGHVIDFDDIPSGAALHRLGTALAPSWTHAETSAWLEHAAAATDRSKRQQSEGAGFIGEPDPERSANGPDDAWLGLEDVLADADRLYKLIRSRTWTGR